MTDSLHLPSKEAATGSFLRMPDNYLHKKDGDALIFCDILVFPASYLFYSILIFLLFLQCPIYRTLIHEILIFPVILRSLQ